MQELSFRTPLPFTICLSQNCKPGYRGVALATCLCISVYLSVAAPSVKIANGLLGSITRQ